MKSTQETYADIAVGIGGNGKVGKKGKVRSFEELFRAVTQAT